MSLFDLMWGIQSNQLTGLGVTLHVTTSEDSDPD